MITNVLINYLDKAISGFNIEKGKNLFAENGRGEQCVILSATADTAISNELTFVRVAPVSILVKGFGIQDGMILTDRICWKLERMNGVYTYVIKTITNPTPPPATLNISEIFDISSISVRNWATMIKPEGVFSANVEVVFKKTET